MLVEIGSEYMEKNRGLHLVYKDLGQTPNEAILNFKNDNPEYKDVRMTYAGRLDPMAEGLLVVLSGDEINNKDEYLGLNKVYVCEVLWGFETDTLDVLGKVTSTGDFEVGEENIREELEKTKGKFVQKYPAYSSKPVLGKPLFEWARQGRIEEVEIPSHEVEVFKCSFISRRFVSKKDLLDSLESKIKSVSGDFRQEDILSIWKEVLDKSKEDQFLIDKIELEVSSGFYVRQFVSDLAEKLKTKAIAFHIKRNSIGEYNLNGVL